MTVAPAARLGTLLAHEPLVTLARLGEQREQTVALVGGAVRDSLLGRSVVDLDLVVVGDLLPFLDEVEHWLGRRPSWIGDRFQQTHRFRRAGYQVDVAAAQGSLRRDLARRDFTINAMAVPLAVAAGPTIVDPHGGRADLDAGILRATSAGVLAADPLRVLRAVRYCAQLRLDIDAATRRRLRHRSADLALVAVERVVAEWEAILRVQDWSAGVQLAGDLGASDPTLGSLGAAVAVTALGVEETTSFDLRLAAVVFDRAAADGTDRARATLQALRWPPRRLRRAFRVAEWAQALPASGPSQWVDWALADESAARDAAILGQAVFPLAAAECAGLREACGRAAASRWISGSDLEAWGMAPGPALGALLTEAARGQVGARWRSASQARAWARRKARAGTAGVRR